MAYHILDQSAGRSGGVLSDWTRSGGVRRGGGPDIPSSLADWMHPLAAEPVASTAPQMSEVSQLHLTRAHGAAIAMLCPGQASPVPTFRYDRLASPVPRLSVWASPV